MPKQHYLTESNCSKRSKYAYRVCTTHANFHDVLIANYFSHRKLHK
uniref:Uncharacterized protein n=1 Tax=Rhizophora mucronata TaxID=61149 RepID=A0A2P2J2P9_RHIMU